MAYQSNIPQPTDRRNDSQLDLLNNFIALEATIQLNHGDINGADDGKHKFVTFPQQAASPVTAGNDMDIVNKNSVRTARSELWLVDNIGVGNDFPFTASLKADEGWCYIPSGQILKWGSRGAGGGAGVQTYTFPVGAAIPAFTNCRIVVLTPWEGGDADISINLSVITNLTFDVNMTNKAGTATKDFPFTYFAIGD